MGYLPGVYLEGIQRKQQQQQQPAKEIEDGGRVNTMTSLVNDGSSEGDRASSLKVEAKRAVPPVVDGKAGDISAESFQRSQFYH